MHFKVVALISILASHATALTIPHSDVGQRADIDERLANSWGAAAGNTAKRADVDERLANSWGAAAGNAAKRAGVDERLANSWGAAAGNAV